MQLNVQVRGQAVRFFPGGKGSFVHELAEPSNVGKLLDSLGVNPALVITVVNGQKTSMDHMLKDGDNVLFFSPMAGG